MADLHVTEAKKLVMTQYALAQGDTGSPEVQIALLTARINEITTHLQTHKKDHIAKRGLLILISQRNSLLKYMVKKNKAKYEDLCKKLSIRVKF